MTRDETIAFWQQCERARGAALAEGKSGDEAHEAAKSIWNAWAARMLEARRALEASGQFIAKKNDRNDDFVAAETVSSDPRTLAWMQAARVDFSGFVFERAGGFSRVRFPRAGILRRFRPTTGQRPDDTQPPSPRAPALAKQFFIWMLFSAGRSLTSRAGFRDAEFRGIARFNECKFLGTAWFFRARFFDEVWFGQCRFGGYTNFSKARFDGVTSFSAARCDGAFTLGEAVFAKLPDLVQTSFRETPRLDNLSLPAPGFFPGLSPKAALEEQAKFRAIRRLAIAGQDYENEVEGVQGRDPIKARYARQAMARGILVRRDVRHALRFRALGDAAILLLARLNRGFHSGLSRGRRQAWRLCRPVRRPNADAVPHWLNALALSAKTALVFAGTDRKMEQQYACLYGDTVPVTSTFIQMGQTVWSAILIFLFILAVRNRFKIK